MSSSCWVCGGATRAFWRDRALYAIECVSCGHIQAEHHGSVAAEGADYHLGYAQGAFVESLGLTRRRQAGRLLDALFALERPPRSLFDFGCGRGWLLEAAQQRGLTRVAGGDVSELALDLLAERQIAGVQLDQDLPFEKLDFRPLGFEPEVLTFLDVIEHFKGDLTARLVPWLRELPPTVRLLVFKVPIREGLMFTLANQARRFGLGGLGRQLFQVGTYPPHYQFFTRRSLASFAASLGLQTLATLDDIDFEPAGLAARLTSSSPLVRGLGRVAGHVLGSAATHLGRADSRILIAERRV